MNVPKELKSEVLAGLFNNSKPLGMGMLHFVPGNMPIKDAEKLLTDTDHNGDVYFDYLQGRVMKTNFRADTDEVKTHLYNRDNGEGAAEKVLEEILNK